MAVGEGPPLATPQLMELLGCWPPVPLPWDSARARASSGTATPRPGGESRFTTGSTAGHGGCSTPSGDPPKKSDKLRVFDPDKWAQTLK